KGQIEHRDPFDTKTGVIDGRIAPGINHYLVRGKQPFWARKLAGGHSAIRDHIVIGTGFLNYLAGKKEGIRGGEDGALAADLHADTSNDVLKAAGFVLGVVGAPSGLNVLIIRTAFEHKMAFALDLS